LGDVVKLLSYFLRTKYFDCGKRVERGWKEGWKEGGKRVGKKVGPA